MDEKFITYNNVSLCTEYFGNRNNPAILLSPGATVSMLFWDEEFCRQLAERGFFVIRYDNRDVGRSTNYEMGTTPYDIVDFTDDAIAILNDYKIAKAHFVGISLGGMVAQIAALRYPGRVLSLTLFSTMPWCDPESEIPEMDRRILEFQAKAANVDWTNEDCVVEYMLQGAYLTSGKKTYDMVRGERLIRAEFSRANNYISMFNHAGLQGGDEYYNRLDEIDLSTLIIHGTQDLVCHFNHTKTMLNKFANSRLVKLEGTGHELHYSDWNIIIEEITKHITCK